MQNSHMVAKVPGFPPPTHARPWLPCFPASWAENAVGMGCVVCVHKDAEGPARREWKKKHGGDGADVGDGVSTVMEGVHVH